MHTGGTAPTAERFVRELGERRSERDMEKVRRFYRGPAEDGEVLGVPMGAVFDLAKTYIDMPIEEVDVLLGSRCYEVRMGAVSMMDFQARRASSAETHKAALFELYIRRHDRINNWDFVDRAAPAVVGNYLRDKPKDILFQLACSSSPWERRTAIVSTHAFIKQGNVDVTFAIAGMLVRDSDELVQKAVGSWIREAGKKDADRLTAFLDRHAATMPRVALRYAVEKLDADTRGRYMLR